VKVRVGVERDRQSRGGAGSGVGIVDLADAVRRAGFPVQRVSVGSSPSARYAATIDGVTEIRPGTYVFQDVTQVRMGAATLDDCALTVLATVVSVPSEDRAVVDAGSKALSSDVGIGLGYGVLKSFPEFMPTRLSEEHGLITSGAPIEARIGERVVIEPMHVCTTVNLHGALLVLPENGSKEWARTEPRGWQGPRPLPMAG